jgi:thiol-disulfide isomerase/thioredoxin
MSGHHLSWRGAAALIGAVVLGGAAGTATVASSTSATSSSTSAVAVQGIAVREVRPLTAAELEQVLAAERGKLVLLNLWATWCVPCLNEIPDLVTLEREFGERGLVVIGVAMDEPSGLQSLVRPFHAKHFPAFRSYMRGEPDMDSMASTVDPAWNELLPTTYLIGRNGKVLGRIQGKRTLAQFRELVTESL